MAEEFVWNESFQLKVLALYVREPQACFDIIQPAYFTNPIHQEIARLTKDIYKVHNRREVRLSQSSLGAVVRGFLGRKRRRLWRSYRKVVKMVFADQLEDRPVVQSQVLEFAREQKFREALVSAEKSVNSRNFSDAIKQFDALKGFGSERNLGVEYWRDPDDPARWRDDRRGLVGTFYLPTLDQRMGGGLGCGELGIILAGGKKGKSTLLGRFAAGALWQNKNVAIATGELSAEKYRKRIDAMVTGIPSWKLTQWAQAEFADTADKKGLKLLRRAQERMRQASSQMKGRLWIRQWPTNKGKIGDIEAWLDELKDSGVKIDVLFVDYIRVFKPNERFEEQRLSIGQIALDLRGLAVERDIPVWTAQQANRAALKKERLEPSDLAEDISSFWTLDFLIALCQTDQEAGTEDDRKKGLPEKARVVLVSARDVGMSGSTLDVLMLRDTFAVKEAKKKRV